MDNGSVEVPRPQRFRDAMPRSVFTHDVGRITAAPLPSVIPTAAPACDLYRDTRLVAGGDGVARLRQALALICPLEKGGLGDDVSSAARALSRATIEFGLFTATGVDSTMDAGARIVWLNARYALRSVPLEQLAPSLLHEAFHLIDPDAPVTAERELRARAVELAVCKQLVPIDDWPRSCRDADGLLRLDRARALALLESAGYPR
jgi:hypothetical protein